MLLEGRQILRPFLEPKRVAIIGVSRTPDRPGYLVIKNLKDFGFEGEIYPVNPGGGDVLGIKIYKEIRELPEDIDLALSLIPAEETVELLNQLALKGIRNVIIVSGGFSESGDEGKRRQEEIVKIAKQMGLRIMGPNAVGPVNTENNLVLPFYPLDSIKRGEVAFIAQSGQFCCPVMEYVNSFMALGVSKSIDLGNSSDIDEIEVLEYLHGDKQTKVIAVYMETIRRGREFVEMVKRVSRDKPVIVFKSGRTGYGLRAAESHTGAMAVDDRIFDSAIRQAGAIRARDLDEFLDFAKIFSFSMIPKGNRVAIVTYSGGVGSMVADECEESGLRLVELTDHLVNKIKPILPISTRISNPLDCFSAGVPPDIFDSYRIPLLAFMEDQDIDMVISCFVLNRVWSIDAQRLIKELKGKIKKPISVWVAGDYTRIRAFTETIEENGIPVFLSPERAVRAMGALWRYKMFREKKEF
jgi:acyl-CoA synthetase (NDP forming)